MGSDSVKLPPRWWESASPKVGSEIMEIKTGTDCAEVEATTKGGLLVTSTDAVGTRVEFEVDKKGDVYFSRHCGEGVNSFQKVESDGKIVYDSCKIERVWQGSVSPAKLEKARALILGFDKKVPKKVPK